MPTISCSLSQDRASVSRAGTAEDTGWGGGREGGGNGSHMTNAEKMHVGQRRRADIKSVLHLFRSRAQRCGHM